MTHSNVFYSPAWAEIYPHNKPARLFEIFKTSDYLVRHQIESGLSYGVFDKAYQFKYASSATADNGGVGPGALCWDENNQDTATSDTLLAQMDFPLVSVALAYDAAIPLNPKLLEPLVDSMPFYRTLMKRKSELDKRDPETRNVPGPNQVVKRNGTSTRTDYEGLGLMKKLAHFLMRRMAELGFKGIEVDCLNDAVHHVWLHPPSPFRATLILEIRINQLEEKDEEGGVLILYPSVSQRSSRIYVDLK